MTATPAPARRRRYPVASVCLPVMNHDVGEDVVRGFRDAAAEFFTMPAEAKLPYCSNDQSKPFRLATSTTYDYGEMRYWLDYLKLQCHPVTDGLVRQWTTEPTSFRPCLTDFSVAVHELAQTMLRLIAKGLGLGADFFACALSGGDTQMNVNYYPPCSDPSLTLGLLPHFDPHLLTILSQGDVVGLQARHNRWWLLIIRPVPSAFVINFIHQMEIFTNGALTSVEHRVVTNSVVTRMSVAILIMPKMECYISKEPEILDEATNPAKFREFVFSEFMEAYYTAAASKEEVPESFRIQENYIWDYDYQHQIEITLKLIELLDWKWLCKTICKLIITRNKPNS
ncbi:2'-deoxymugineic-acid 2'-dioxygenase-like [Lolium rigidum]|uniref:2'-deoxymugineic-acid 2'-dioxygenase-like n=1 Tax=Lolium rigidum TaxID=89674 RepID=UPI001F5DD46D|nr:2'-deoxymugineic-acid 2'-dioxygenase-like [Lolium rigidum]